MLSVESVFAALRDVNDPEMPINIVDLGIVEAVRLARDAEIEIDVTPTFVGCPALPVIESDIRRRVAALPGVSRVRVSFVYDPPWSVDRISAAGRESLARVGITVPQPGSACSSGALPDERRLVPLSIGGDPRDAVACPLCGSADTSLESAFGPTRCKMIYYCERCRNQFEHMKRV
ncbi:putative 1,2-phenylacetyl-CoA epoxidase, subunit D [Phycisphaerae bacterium RAS1]|nr:putative 1,2-phenylacetyl-CoA epoxidase, subunit D [Phycisphaerae bacterium RAS1]